jgi:hypothetical protein
MITVLLIAAAAIATTIIFALAGAVLDLRAKLMIACISVEEEQAWSDKYALDAIAAEAELATLRRDYAALLAAHHRSTLPVLSGAWRAGLGKPGPYQFR